MMARRFFIFFFVVASLGLCLFMSLQFSHAQTNDRSDAEAQLTSGAQKIPESVKTTQTTEAAKPQEENQRPKSAESVEAQHNAPEKKTPEAMTATPVAATRSAEQLRKTETVPVVVSAGVNEAETIVTKPVVKQTYESAAVLAEDAPAPAVFSWEKGTRITFKLIRIKAGSFMIGSDDVPGASPVKVTLTEPFSLGETEVTQALYLAVMGTNPSHFQSPQRPVEQVSWEDAVTFCEKLNEGMAGSLPAGWKFMLPTEAQWEYAARSGAAGNYGGAEMMDDTGWNVENSNQWADGDVLSENNHYGTHEVAKKKPNAWGLYDMNGNVWEWCGDWYVKDFKKDNHGSLLVDPTGPETGSYRVRRGGSWWDSAFMGRNDYRDWFAPKYRRDHVGFRLALVKVAAKAN